jgi:hypothetical protein|eukprot:SAG25_NODE_201_length_11995_cov_74.743695_7_plen_213_part_00
MQVIAAGVEEGIQQQRREQQRREQDHRRRQRNRTRAVSFTQPDHRPPTPPQQTGPGEVELLLPSNTDLAHAEENGNGSSAGRAMVGKTTAAKWLLQGTVSDREQQIELRTLELIGLPDVDGGRLQKLVRAVLAPLLAEEAQEQDGSAASAQIELVTIAAAVDAQGGGGRRAMVTLSSVEAVDKLLAQLLQKRLRQPPPDHSGGLARTTTTRS